MLTNVVVVGMPCSKTAKCPYFWGCSSVVGWSVKLWPFNMELGLGQVTLF